MLLENELIKLRAVEAEDLDRIYRWENDTRLWDCTSTIAPFSRKQIYDYIANYDGDIFAARQLRLMIVEKSGGKEVGMIDLYDFDAVNRRAYVGLFVDASHRRKGLAEASLDALAVYCESKIGMRQLAAIVAADNEVSLRVFESKGFEVSGLLRSWLKRGQTYADAYFLQKLF